jgi:hypothetical protein
VDIPADTPEGDHTVQIDGETIDGDETEIAVPVTVALDVMGPVFGTAWVSAANVDVTSGAQTIDVSFTATDDVSGVASVQLVAIGDAGYDVTIDIGQATLSDGTIQDGTWTATLTIPAGTASQTVEVSRLGFPRDNVGNYGAFEGFDQENYCGSEETGPLYCPAIATFTITGPTE